MIWQRDYMKSYAERPDDPWVQLAHAIVLQAVKDLRKSMRNGENLYQYKAFFHSSWFNVLTRDRLNGPAIYYRLTQPRRRRRKKST